MTSASLLIVFLVGTVVGALTGLVLGGSIGTVYLAILAGFLGSIAALFVRNTIIARGAGIGPDDSRTPILVIIYAAVASLAGSLAAKEVLDLSEISSAPVGLGALAGLFSAFLLAMLMITYYTNPGEPPMLRKRS
ncbi:MAG: hypothetical protein ACRECX_06655 [Methyloceanibacter sp.]|uniref:hypothetical protein n=1 Tax=Methyloceanibacter sp. TaxID=1965321 RepID=UPI003D6D6E76